MLPPAGLVGLCLSYALSITSLLSGLIFSFTQTELQMVSVERTEEYSSGLPIEPQQQHTQVRALGFFFIEVNFISQDALLQSDSVSCQSRLTLRSWMEVLNVSLLSPPQLPPAWPDRGRLQFQDVVLSYRDGLPNALDGLDLEVQPGEKVGIVGRTGSGKSTLFLALFRMVELNQGQILLDGLDISTVDLAQLR